MGNHRATPGGSEAYLSQLNLTFYGICKAAVGGHAWKNYDRLGTQLLGQPSGNES